jgi:hypothetical protein
LKVPLLALRIEASREESFAVALWPAPADVEDEVPGVPELDEVVVELPETEGVPELFELHAARLSPVSATIAASVTSRRPRATRGRDPNDDDPDGDDPDGADPEILDIEPSFYLVPSSSARIASPSMELWPEDFGPRIEVRGLGDLVRGPENWDVGKSYTDIYRPAGIENWSDRRLWRSKIWVRKVQSRTGTRGNGSSSWESAHLEGAKKGQEGYRRGSRRPGIHQGYCLNARTVARVT